MAPTAPRTPAAHQYDLTESRLPTSAECASTTPAVPWRCWSRSPTLAIAAILADEDNHGRR